MAKRQIYLDHAATTPLDPRVFDAMLPYLKEHFGNASSVHALGRKARYAVEESRERISAILGVAPGDVIFTSGGTESNNAAIKGVLKNSAGGVLTSVVEHEAVLTQAKGLESAGNTVKFLPPDRYGRISLAQIQEQQLDDIAIMSFMHANNEVGVLNDISAIGEFCASKDIIFHTDAVQTAGWYDWQSVINHVDLVSISAHKFYGPKGAGCLVATRNAEIKGIIEGGSQERRRRGGTENVAGIVGMAEALALASQERDARVSHLSMLQVHLLKALESTLGKDRYVLNTSTEPSENAPHIVNIAFPPIDGEAVDGEMLILNLDVEGVLVSSGSACTSGAIEPSHVLLGLNLDQDTASAAVRFSMGKDNTLEEIDYAVDKLGMIMKRMREKSNV
ncbi:MAG: cysteine desulfurase family protein [Rhodothermales bacterium]